jgi:hypothetical protein
MKTLKTIAAIVTTVLALIGLCYTDPAAILAKAKPFLTR